MKTEGVASLYRLLLRAYGPQGWWPADGAWEMAVGAILTQRVAWRNAEAAIQRLRRSKLLSAKSLDRAPVEAIAEAVRPALFYNAKAAKLKALAHVVAADWGGDLFGLLAQPTDALRHALLEIHGIGSETADVILLYAAKRPAFVADRYALRLFERLGWMLAQTRTERQTDGVPWAQTRAERQTDGVPWAQPCTGGKHGRWAGGAAQARTVGAAQTRPVGAGYETVRAAVMAAWPADADDYGELHALIVRHGKERCGPRPVCSGCPVRRMCLYPKRKGDVR
jgi:endonuclease-3 related protein